MLGYYLFTKYLKPPFFKHVKTNVKEKIVLKEMSREELQRHIEKRLPLSKGDIVTFESGRKYKVDGFLINGSFKSTHWYLTILDNSFIKIDNNYLEDLRFNSLRELNHYVSTQLVHLIINITKNEAASPYKEPSIDACHKLALAENKTRDIYKAQLNELIEKGILKIVEDE